MVDFDWCSLEAIGLVAKGVWHAVRPESPTTVCGEAVANPDEEWRWVDRLGNRRSCDNCTHVLAHEVDAEDPPTMSSGGSPAT